MRRLVCTGILLLVSASLNVHAQERSFVSKETETKLKGNSFLSSRCTSDRKSSCRPYVDFAADCGVSASVEDLNIEGVKDHSNRSFLISDVAALSERLKQYPPVLKAIGEWDDLSQQKIKQLEGLYRSAADVANGVGTPLEKLIAARAILKEAEDVSKNLADHAGLAYDGGCGAGPEDSQKIDFEFSSRPKTALYILQMDLDACKAVLNDPYDPKQCDAWEAIQSKDNELSGYYTYRVTWQDGSTSERAFSALGKGRKTVHVDKPQ